MSIKFSANEIRYIALFENMTGAMVKDCIIDDEHGKVTFVVKNGDMGLAIGKKGSSVSKVQRAVDKGVEIIELDYKVELAGHTFMLDNVCIDVEGDATLNYRTFKNFFYSRSNWSTQIRAILDSNNTTHLL